MKKIKISIPAKINLTLDVLSNSNGYHEINSFVVSVRLYDKILISKRKDKEVKISCYGIPLNIKEEENNAYVTAKKFIEKFNCLGVNIKIIKNIPLSSGLGGSSADIAGVIIGMKKLFNIEDDCKNFASMLGSDVNYMMVGGYAVLKGKGDKVKSLNINKKLYFILALSDETVNTRECYKLYDELKLKSKEKTDCCIKYLVNKKFENFKNNLDNDLLIPACKICMPVEKKLNILKKYSLFSLTGSGSCIFTVFEDRKERDKIYKSILKNNKIKLIKTESI